MSSFNTQILELPLSSKKNADSNETISDSEYSCNFINHKQSKQSNNNYNRGRWSLDEHNKFIEGLVKYGSFWKSIQKHISTRSPAQVRSHAQKFFLMCKKRISQEHGDISNPKDQIKQLFVDFLDKAEEFNQTIYDFVKSFDPKPQEMKNEQIFKIEKKSKKSTKYSNKEMKFSKENIKRLNNDKNKKSINHNEIDVQSSKRLNPFNMRFDSIDFLINDNQHNLLDSNNIIDNDEIDKNLELE